MSEPDATGFSADEQDDFVLDPGDTLADPERLVRLRVHDGLEDEARRERDADAALSDVGSGAINRRGRRREED